jgi:hypothetical protein
MAAQGRFIAALRSYVAENFLTLSALSDTQVGRKGRAFHLILVCI